MLQRCFLNYNTYYSIFSLLQKLHWIPTAYKFCTSFIMFFDHLPFPGYPLMPQTHVTYINTTLLPTPAPSREMFSMVLLRCWNPPWSPSYLTVVSSLCSHIHFSPSTFHLSYSTFCHDHFCNCLICPVRVWVSWKQILIFDVSSKGNHNA